MLVVHSDINHALIAAHLSLPRIASCASFMAASCRSLKLAACFRISSKKSSLEDMAPSTRAAAASDRLLKIPIATNESRVSTTRLFILATTGMSRSSPSNPSAEMFFNTRSRRERRFGFSSFSVTMVNPIRIDCNLFIKLRIAYLAYILRGLPYELIFWSCSCHLFVNLILGTSISRFVRDG